MSRDSEGQPIDDKAPLPEDILKGLVGGKKGGEPHPIDGDRAAAMTAGAEGGHQSGGFVDVAKTGFPAAALTGASGGIKVASSESTTGAQAKPAEPAAPGSNIGFEPSKADTGAPKVEGARPAAPQTSPEEAIVKDFQNIQGTKLKAGEELAKTYWKGTVEKDLTGSDPSKTKVESPTKDAEKAAAEKATKAADEHRQNLLSQAEQANQASKDVATKVAGQQAIKVAEKDVKTAFDTVVKSQQEVLKNGDGAIKGAQNLLNLAQDIHKTNVGTVKMTETNLADAVKSGKAEDIQKAKIAYMDALKEQRASQTVVDGHRENLLKMVGEKVETKAKDLNKADDVLKKAREDGDVRPRSQSVPVNPASPAGETPSTGRGSASTTGDAPKGTDAATHAEKALRDADTARKAAETQKQADDKAKKSEENRGKAIKFGDQVISQILNEAARNDSKDKGTYKNTIGTEVTHGGVDSTTETLADGSTLTTNTLARTTLTQGVESWDSPLGKGANTIWAPKAEAGYETVHTHKDASGNDVSVKDKVYGSAEFENKAGYSITKDHLDAEASSKLTLHAEASHSTTQTILGMENTTTTTVAGHAEAQAKAGLHLGYDGLKAEVKVSAEATVSATAKNETKIGDVTTTVSGTVFAQAKAEAHAGADVTFDPKNGIKAKVGGGFEATAGVGADVNVGLMSDSGNGVGGTAHFKAGSVGVKFEPDLSIKDGKVDFKLSVGGYLGVGGTYDFQIKGDYNKAVENVKKMNDFLEKSDNPIVKVAGHHPGVYVWSALSGFFS